MVSALGDGDVREEASAVLPLLYDLRRARCGDDAATASTAQDLLHMLDAHELRGHELPHARDLAVAERSEIRAPARRAATEGVRHFVVDPQSFRLCFGLGASLSRRLRLRGRRGLAGLHARHLRPLAARAVERLLQLRILVLEPRDSVRELRQEVLQRAVMVHGRQNHRPVLITGRDLCRSPFVHRDSISRDDAR
jgi:hypothetical protein